MAEWLVEQGIGEERALLIDGDAAIGAALRWPGRLEAGLVEDAVLVSRQRGSGRGTAQFAGGEEALVDRLPRDAGEGAHIRLEVTRPALGEAARTKRAHARPSQAACRAAPELAEVLGARRVHAFPPGSWEEVWAEARAGTVDFSGGSLVFSPTPAMTLVDIDGTLPPRDLALAAVDPLARALRRFGIGGMVGVDFPTLSAKEDRKAVDRALGIALADRDHERTAMNGFGFVQIVSRLERASLLHLLHQRPASAAARFLLRQAEGVTGPGAIELAAHPAVVQRIEPAWLDELARRTGREVTTRPEPALALHAAFAQAVAR